MEIAIRYRETVKGFCMMSSIALLLAILTTIINTNTLAAQSSKVADFETWCAWKQGDQSWGEFTQSKEQVLNGSFAGKLEYNFPVDEAENFVVFICPVPVPGQPKALSLWVYGDGSNNFLNTWVKDAKGQGWQFSFGQISHTGWKEMVAILDPSLPWPNDPLDSSEVTEVVYPISFYALVLDNPTTVESQGIIYVDDLFAPDPNDLVVTPTATPTSIPIPTLTPTTIPQQTEEISFWADEYTINEGQCTTLRWSVQYVKAIYLEDSGKTGDGEEVVCPKENRTYTLKIVTHTDDEFRTVTIEVRNPFVNYYADSQTIVYGQCTYLNWNTQNVQSVYLNDNPTDTNGSSWICPEYSTTYTLRVITSLGEQVYSIIVKVVNPVLCINSSGGEYLIYEVSSKEILRFPDPVYIGGDSGNFFVITNCGSDPLILQRIEVDDKDNEFRVKDILNNFSSQTDINGVLSPGGQCYVQLLFAPMNNYSEHRSWLYIHSNSSDGGFKPIFLTGKSKSRESVAKSVSRSDGIGRAESPITRSISPPIENNCLTLPQN